MTRTFTVQARAVEKIANAAVVRGVTAQSLYESVNFDPATLLDPDSRIPFAQLVALYENAAKLTGDDHFGLHIGESVNVTAFDVVGYCAMNSSNLGETSTARFPGRSGAKPCRGRVSPRRAFSRTHC